MRLLSNKTEEDAVKDKRKTEVHVKIANADVARIARAAAVAMRTPGAFAIGGLSYTSHNRPANVFSASAMKCDGLGWILKKAREMLKLNKNSINAAYRVSEILNQEILDRTGNSLVALGDEEGGHALAKILQEIADHFERS